MLFFKSEPGYFLSCVYIFSFYIFASKIGEVLGSLRLRHRLDFLKVMELHTTGAR